MIDPQTITPGTRLFAVAAPPFSLSGPITEVSFSYPGTGVESKWVRCSIDHLIVVVEIKDLFHTWEQAAREALSRLDRWRREKEQRTKEPLR